MTKELKACPFCGKDLSSFPEVMTITPCTSDAYVQWQMEHNKLIGTDDYYVVRCIGCGATGARGATREWAAKNWNRRTEK
jgi:hypothetical protein